MKEKRTSKSWIVAGVLFAIFVLIEALVPVISNYVSVASSAWRWSWLGCCAVLAIALLLSKRIKIMPIVGFATISVYNSAAMLLGEIDFWVILEFVADISALLVCFLFLIELLPKCKEICKKLWFVPVICEGAVAIYYFILNFSFFLYATSHGDIGGILLVVKNFIFAVGFLFALMWVVFPTGFSENGERREDRQTIEQAEIAHQDYCGLLKHILLLLFTFGIWQLIWIYKVTGYTNAAKNEEYRNPTTKLLLCMLVPFYIIYWTYKTAQRVDAMAAEKGVQSDMATLCLLLAIFVGILPPILLQDKINSIIVAKGYVTLAPTEPVITGSVEQTPATEAANTAEALKMFKNLLDTGVITQEEFDAKKKQLLGL